MRAVHEVLRLHVYRATPVNTQTDRLVIGQLLTYYSAQLITFRRLKLHKHILLFFLAHSTAFLFYFIF